MKKKKNFNRFDLIFPQMQICQTKLKPKSSSSRGSSNPQQTSVEVKLTTSHIFQVQRRSRGAGRPKPSQVRHLEATLCSKQHTGGEGSLKKKTQQV